MSNIESLIILASTDPLDPKKNFDIAVEYEKLGQTASAISFYLRAAEYGYESNKLMTYASLIKISSCFLSQGNRNHTVSNSLLQAIAYMPNRPEAYLAYSRLQENLQKWQESYTFAEIGLSLPKTYDDLPVDVGYPGLYALEFQKAVAGWWIGRKNESISIFKDLVSRDIKQEYKEISKNNLERLVG